MSLILIPDWLGVPPGLVDDGAVVDTEVPTDNSSPVVAEDIFNAFRESFG